MRVTAACGYSAWAAAIIRAASSGRAPGSAGADTCLAGGVTVITLDTIDLQITALGAGSGLKLEGLDLGLKSSDGTYATNGARAALSKIDDAMDTVNQVLGKIGASQNRIQYTQDNLKATIVNFSAAESVIRDLDMADEMTKFSKNNIISQAATAMLAQANQSTQGVLQLLRG